MAQDQNRVDAAQKVYAQDYRLRKERNEIKEAVDSTRE
jgi:hypothetical protein